MINNPFSPVFGGKPKLFFGRKHILSRFERALRDEGSEDRALFVTGTRGSGKTALIEQLSLRAKRKGWLVIDLGPEDTVRTLARRLAGHDEETRTVDPQLSVSILGSGGSIGGVSTARTTRVERGDLDLLLIETCSNVDKGVMVTVDEIQKLSEDDVSAISNAFQMASRKGMDAILVVAGLPFSHDEVIRYEGCTFMRRAVHERLSLLDRSEVIAAFDGTMSRVGIEFAEQCIPELVRASYGHPYMVQLLGYHLVDIINCRRDDSSRLVGLNDVRFAVERAVDAYSSRALRPMVAELPPSDLAYLMAMARCLDEQRTARSSDVARALGKDVKQASPARARLMRSGIVLAPHRGQLMFAVPYLASYVLELPEEASEVERIRAWGV
jgi:hypothetical protein